MITEAQIVALNDDNTCIINIPLFQTVNTTLPVRVEAVFLSLPGIYGGYKVGDLVWVAFERNQADSPVILGKIYKGVTFETKQTGSSVKASNLQAITSAELPLGTKFTNAEDGYTTIQALINKIKDLEVKPRPVYELSIKIPSYGNIMLQTNIAYDNNNANNALSILGQNLAQAGFSDSQNIKSVISKTIFGIFVARNESIFNQTGRTQYDILGLTTDNTLVTIYNALTGAANIVVKCKEISNI